MHAVTAIIVFTILLLIYIYVSLYRDHFTNMQGYIAEPTDIMGDASFLDCMSSANRIWCVSDNKCIDWFDRHKCKSYYANNPFEIAMSYDDNDGRHTKNDL